MQHCTKVPLLLNNIHRYTVDPREQQLLSVSLLKLETSLREFSNYPAIGPDTKFTVCFLCVCTVTDFSAGALPIGLKFYMAVRPDPGQVFSYLGDSPRNGRILGVSRAPYGGICFLLKHLFSKLF